MNIYLFQSISDLTDNYHDGGSAMVIAESVEKAINSLPVAAQTEASNDWVAGRVRSWPLPLGTVVKPEMFIFPDAGCC